jgi:hypothetical protein
MEGDATSLARAPAGRRIPLWVSAAYTAFIAVLVPYYWRWYGPANFLWFCDIALFLALIALWTESRFLASMQLVAVLLPSAIWLVDFLGRLATGTFPLNWTVYMFRPEVPLIIRALSLFHAWFPFLLLWAVWRLGYDGRGWVAQSVLAWVVLPICYCCTAPRRGINGAFGMGGEHLQEWVPPLVWLGFVMVLYPLAVFLPTHLLLRALFPPRRGK